MAASTGVYVPVEGKWDKVDPESFAHPSTATLCAFHKPKGMESKMSVPARAERPEIHLAHQVRLSLMTQTVCWELFI